jgi:hypothetical protein
MYSSRPERSSKYELPVMPWISGQTPQQIDALFVLVTDGIDARTRRKIPLRRYWASTGISLCSRYSRPNPSHIITTARCGVRCAKAGAEINAALAPRNRRRFMLSPRGAGFLAGHVGIHADVFYSPLRSAPHAYSPRRFLPLPSWLERKDCFPGRTSVNQLDRTDAIGLASMLEE